MWALIEEGKVKELTNIDPNGRFHPSLVWVECGDEVKAGYVFDGSDFFESPPYIPSEDQQRAARRAAYSAESDHLFMAWQADLGNEAKKLAWLEKREEIERRYPLP